MQQTSITLHLWYYSETWAQSFKQGDYCVMRDEMHQAFMPQYEVWITKIFFLKSSAMQITWRV